MSTYHSTPPDKDPQLWEIAQRRASFKTHVFTYIIVNIFLWAVWALTDGKGHGSNNLPWPVWPTMGWAVGLFFHYMGAYIIPRSNSVEKEYEKLTRNKN